MGREKFRPDFIGGSEKMEKKNEILFRILDRISKRYLPHSAQFLKAERGLKKLSRDELNALDLMMKTSE